MKARGRQSLAARLVRKSAGSYPMVQYARNVMAVTEVRIGGFHEEEALARRRLDRADWWHRGRDHLSSRLRADFRISPLIFCVQFSVVDHNTSG